MMTRFIIQRLQLFSSMSLHLIRQGKGCIYYFLWVNGALWRVEIFDAISLTEVGFPF